MYRIALANLRFPATPEESVTLAEDAIAQAAAGRAGIICFPECFVPGYRGMGKTPPPPDPAFLDRAWTAICSAAANAGIAVILGTERIVDGGLHITALVVNPDGTVAGFQDKVQLDPSEESIYTPGTERHIFQTGELTFGIAICHEGWRYPETVRWAARRGAQVVFHPHFHQAEPGSFRPTTFADPANSFHEKAALCRAAENTCYFAMAILANADGSNQHSVTGTNTTDAEPKINPKTGNQIAFVSGRSGREQVYLMNTDGTAVERLSDGTGEASNPSWHPNGQILAFAWTQGYAPGTWNIFVMDVARHTYNQLTSGTGKNENPVWAPDGRHLVFMSTRSGRPQIWSMAADGTQLRQLTAEGVNSTPTWGR
jgi:predicted amidohydrolase